MNGRDQPAAPISSRSPRNENEKAPSSVGADRDKSWVGLSEFLHGLKLG